jgi:hypothetical protein
VPPSDPIVDRFSFYNKELKVETVVFYTDESGSTDNYNCPLENGKTPIFTLSSVALPLQQWRSFDRDFNNLKAKFFPEELTRKNRKEEIEIKGNEITSPRNKDSSRRQEFLKRSFSLLKKYDGKIFAVTFIKSCKKPISSRSIYTHGFQILLERYDHFIKTSRKYDAGLIICDSRAGAFKGNSLDKEVAKSYQSYIFGNKIGRTLTGINESPLFADSKITVGIQLADIISSVIYTNHYYYYAREIEGAIDYQHMQKWWPAINELEYKYISPDRKNDVFGIRVINHTTA